MMKFLFMLFMLIPLSFMNFWLMQWMFFISVFLFMFTYFSFTWSNISYMLGCDLLSFTLILLSLWICSLMILASGKLNKNNDFKSFFLLVMILLLISLFLTFSSMNLFIFYLFFEISLIPTLILIIGWGYQPERLEAGLYLLFYTMLMSLPMLLMIFYLYKNMSLNFMFLSKDLTSMYMYMCMNFVFFIKIPMFFLHLWLPKAHVEAPVSGSMILAGVMLKLGGYGLLRLMIMFQLFINDWNMLIIVISMLGGFIISLVCMRQSDIKSLIAYSSVSHMGLALAGLMTLNYWGLWGALVMMLAHGLCSSGLFCLANLMYERTFSRSLYLNKGLLNLLPSFSLYWFLLLSSNMAAPPSMNLLSEIMLINSLVSYSYINMLWLSLISFFSAAYSLFLYSYSQHGKFYSSLFSFMNGFSREYLLLLLHWFPLNLFFMKMELFIQWI
uniref:NADH-ubiquinone oxidoreductase chain 4 n=1 Tax=Psylliodes cupreus TaxID=467376 RepID=A0A3G1GQ17_9CUCU|nr:NADH dehydrogenase subunit 4 [Psylliodes cupreus]WNV22567.1 NADH dehydrogenase subunit 4 [Psylliodes crambicola]